jgi:hypothetical protein
MGGDNMIDITRPQAAGAILDGVQRRITPLSHAELIAVNRECQRMRQKPVQRRMTHKWRELDKYKPQPVGRLTGMLLGLGGLVLVIGAWMRR